MNSIGQKRVNMIHLGHKRLNQMRHLGSKNIGNKINESASGNLAHNPEGVINNISNDSNMAYDVIKGINLKQSVQHNKMRLEKPRREKQHSNNNKYYV
jgi:hypothetical protein